VQTLNNVATLDAYSDALRLEQDTADTLTYVIANNPVVARFRPVARRGGAAQPYGDEILLSPSTNTVHNVSGAQFRSANAGQAARVIALLVSPEDPQLAAGTPFLQTLSASGAIGAVGVIDRVLSSIDIFGINTEQTLYNYNLLAGQIGPTGILEAILGGDFLHNNVAGDTLRFRIYFGPTGGALTPIYDTTDTLGGSLSAIRHPWSLHFWLQNRGATNSQQWHADLNVEPTGVAAPAVGIGNLFAAPGSWKNPPIGLGPGAYVFDTTAPMTLRITVQWSVAAGNDSFALRNGWLEVK
jgi:hypothetical protein